MIRFPKNARALKFPEGNPTFHADHYIWENHLQAWLERIGFRIIKRTRCGMATEGIKLLHQHSPEKTWSGYDMEKDGWMFYFVAEKLWSKQDMRQYIQRLKDGACPHLNKGDGHRCMVCNPWQRRLWP
jgi:hypothetical protein